MHYFHHLWHGLPTLLATVFLLAFFMVLTIVGIGESSKLAIGIFALHLSSLTLLQLALAWTIEHPAVTAALIGPRTEEQLADLLTAVDVRLDPDVLDAIDEVVPPGIDLNPADRGWTPPGLAVDQRRRR
jgi:hypothetical protein